MLKYQMSKQNLRNIFFFFLYNNYLFRSCILEDNLCNWSYGTCSHGNLSQINDDLDLCLKRKSTVDINNCQCDRGYKIEKVKLTFFIII